MDLRGAVVLVTGASRGIGAAVAEELARRGAVVVASGRDEAGLAAVTARTHGTWVAADLRDPGAPTRVVEATLADHGRLDGVVANAGVGWYGPFAAMPPDRLAEIIDVDVRAPLLLARAALPALLARPQIAGPPIAGPPIAGTSTSRPPIARRSRAAIALVSSIAGAVGVPGEAVYSAAKASLEAFAAVLREELRGAGVSVTTVLPGVVETSFFASRGAAYDRRFPRPIPPERVARVVVDALASGAPRRIEPRWLAFPVRLSAVAPRTYRALERRFG